MTAFAAPVRHELDRWAAAGLRVRLWWRDDDAGADTPQLRRLAALARRYDLPVGLASIPQRIEPSLPAAVTDERGALVPQVHGLAHINHATPRRPAEFGPERPRTAVEAELSQALKGFRAAFPDAAPVFVPPFNRIGAQVVRALPDLGFSGLSAWPERPERLLIRYLDAGGVLPPVPRRAAARRFRIDAHISVIAWEGGAHAADAERLGRWTAALLKLRRLGCADAGAPVGLLTHHLDHDEQIWTLTERVLETLAAHPAVVRTSPAACFPSASATLSDAQRT